MIAVTMRQDDIFDRSLVFGRQQLFVLLSVTAYRTAGVMSRRTVISPRPRPPCPLAHPFLRLRLPPHSGFVRRSLVEGPSLSPYQLERLATASRIDVSVLYRKQSSRQFQS